MPFSNLDYLYQHLPARVRRDDENLFLKRFLQFFGTTLDEWDAVHESFYQKINWQTAPDQWVRFWLWALFGWSWFPAWFTLDRKRELYRDFTEHLARRGTKRGIEGFLKAFSVYSIVYSRPQYWGQFAWGDRGWTITDALGVVIQIDHVADEVNFDRNAQGWGEWVWGEGGSFFADTESTLTKREIENLCRFEWPGGQRVMIEYVTRPNVAGIARALLVTEGGDPVTYEDGGGIRV